MNRATQARLDKLVTLYLLAMLIFATTMVLAFSLPSPSAPQYDKQALAKLIDRL